MFTSHVFLSFISSVSNTVLYLISFKRVSFSSIYSAKSWISGIIPLSFLFGDFHAKYLENGAESEAVFASIQSDIIQIEL
jgi:hypothetical protein